MIKKGAKTKNYISILCGLLVTVFACMIGFAYALSPLVVNYGSNYNAPTIYAANQQAIVINDTLVTPIPFGASGQGNEISVQYSVDYDFDIRLEYSMSWSGGGDTSNVILNFVDRDDFIVDNCYIYRAEAVSAGQGKLSVITGVDFVDPSDRSYFGQTLTINVEAKIYKVQDSYTTHPLAVSGSEASTAWLKYKQNAIESGKAYVMMYNYRYNYEYGLPYPGPMTAYNRTANTTTVNGNTVTTYTPDWLGGNTGYAGLGMYIMTGSSSVTLSIYVEGIWRESSSDNASTQFVNNIELNYADNWTHSSWSSDKIFETRTFDYSIPANSTYYIEILDCIEVNSCTLEQYEYDYYRMELSEVVLNGVPFGFTSNISVGTITTTGESKTSYPTINVKEINSSKYNRALYNSLKSSAQTFDTGISLVNDSDNYITVSVSYTLNYKLSNGNNLLTETVNGVATRGDELLGTTGYSDKKSVFHNSLAVYYSVGEALNNYVTLNNAVTSCKIAPHSTVEVCNSYTVYANFYSNYIQSTWGLDLEDYYDVWVWLEPSINTTSTETIANVSTGANIIVEPTISGSTMSVYLKNTTNKVLSNISVTLNAYYYAVTWSKTTTQPADWTASYWNYYTLASDSARVMTLPDIFDSTNGYYYKTYEQKTVTFTTNTISELLPNETKLYATAIVSTTELTIMSAKATSGAIANHSEISLVNAGNKNGYIMNNSTSSYYVRFTGTMANTIANVSKVGSYNYYIGIVRPGQIISVPMTGNTGELSTITYDSTKDYKDSTQLGGWSDIVNNFANYFS